MNILQEALTICMAISGMMIALALVFALIFIWLMFLKYHSDSGDLPEMFKDSRQVDHVKCDSCEHGDDFEEAVYRAFTRLLHETGMYELLQEFNEARKDEVVDLSDAEPAEASQNNVSDFATLAARAQCGHEG